MPLGFKEYSFILILSMAMFIFWAELVVLPYGTSGSWLAPLVTESNVQLVRSPWNHFFYQLIWKAFYMIGILTAFLMSWSFYNRDDIAVRYLDAVIGLKKGG